MHALRDLGVELGQGFLIGHPAPVAPNRFHREAVGAFAR
jgi:EAL domain-containing protein (putative c-di-GMP-specific phosphodiesterase class I)